MTTATETIATPEVGGITLPEPGIYRRMPAAEYHALPYANASFLNAMYRETPAHAMARRINKAEQTDAMKLGTGAHAFLLEPDTIEKLYVCAGQCEGIKQSGERCSNDGTSGFCNTGSDITHWYCGIHSKKIGGEREQRTVLSQDEYNACLGMRTAVQSHPYGKLLLAKSTDVEVVIIWRDEETGVMCKARLDMLCRDLHILPDFKTSDDLTGRRFYWKAQDLGYFRQAAMYRRAYAAQYPKTDMGNVISALVAVESTAKVMLGDGTLGHGCRVFGVDDETLKLSDYQVGRLLKGYAECEQRSLWPAWGDSVEEFGLTQADFRRLSTEEI